MSFICEKKFLSKKLEDGPATTCKHQTRISVRKCASCWCVFHQLLPQGLLIKCCQPIFKLIWSWIILSNGGEEKSFNDLPRYINQQNIIFWEYITLLIYLIHTYIYESLILYCHQFQSFFFHCSIEIIFVIVHIYNFVH